MTARSTFLVLLVHETFTYKYRKVASSNASRLEAHAGFFRLLMKGILDPIMYCDILTNVDFLTSNVR